MSLHYARLKEHTLGLECFILAWMADAEGLARKFKILAGVLDERTRRLVAVAEAEALGFGGVTAVALASGLSRGTMIRGIAGLKTAPKAAHGQRVRRKGAGRNRTIEQLVEPVTRGDPEFPLRCTCKSVRRLAAELKRTGHQTKSSDGGRVTAPGGLQPTGQSEDFERLVAPGSGCPVSPYQRQNPGISSRPSTRHFRGHKEERTGW